MPSKKRQRQVVALIVVHLFDGDDVKAEKMRTDFRGKSMSRRDRKGKVVRSHVVKGPKPRPARPRGRR